MFARTPDGRTPLRPDTVSERFTALARQLGHDYALYGLRHFMATQLGAVAEAGTVRERMGHGDPCRAAAVLLEAARAAWNANEASRRDRSGRLLDSGQPVAAAGVRPRSTRAALPVDTVSPPARMSVRARW